MKQKINTKELSKQIRFDGKRGMVVWSREKEQHFVSNRHFLVRFEEVPNEVLAALFGIFYKLPKVGETLNTYFGRATENVKPINYNGIFLPDQQDNSGEITPYIRDMGKKLFARVIKFPNHHVLINENYIKLAAEDQKPMTKGNSPVSPVYLADMNLIVLPYKNTNNTNDSELVDDLLGADKS